MVGTENDQAAHTAKASRAGTGTRVQRQLPRPSELRELLQFRAPEMNAVKRRLQSAQTIDELRRIGQRTTPRSVFDYVDGAADEEVTASDNVEAFRKARFVPEILHSVATPDITTDLLGKRIAFPLVLAPTGFTRMMHHEGEVAVARAAERNNLPYALSTLGTTDIEGVRDAAPNGDNWFQLYLTNSEALNNELIDRALAAGCTTVVLTTDCAVGGRRLKDVHNGLSIPPSLTFKTFANMSRFPYWWMNKLTTPGIEFASVRDFPGTNAEVAALLFDAGLDYEDLAGLRAKWPHKLLVKGVLSARDAVRVMDAGADGIIVSNHGGRQLDRTPATLDVLPSVREAVGPEATVILDGGIRHGQDVIAAIASGADAAMAGRAYLYGLMAGGERGVERAIEILRMEYQRGLQLIGLDTTSKISRDHLQAASSTFAASHY